MVLVTLVSAATHPIQRPQQRTESRRTDSPYVGDAQIRHPAATLPIEYSEPPSYMRLAFAGFGILFGAFPVVAFAISASHHVPPIVIPFVLFGLGAAWLGIALFFRRESWVVTRSGVSYRCAGLFRPTEWQEPLDAYQGLVYQKQLHSYEMGTNMFWYRILIKHKNDWHRDIELSLDRLPFDSDRELAGFSKLLNLPILPQESSA